MALITSDCDALPEHQPPVCPLLPCGEDTAFAVCSHCLRVAETAPSSSQNTTPFIRKFRSEAVSKQRPELRTGMILVSVQGMLVKGMGYQEAIELITLDRPMTLMFSRKVWAPTTWTVPSNNMARITSDCGTTRTLSIKRP